MHLSTLILTSVLSLVGLTSAAPSTFGRPCGLKIAPCGFGYSCLPYNPICKDLNRCIGRCVFAPIPHPPATFPLPPKTPITISPPKPSSTQLPASSKPTPSGPATREYQSCGGFRASPPPPCPDDTYCADDPRNPMSPFIVDEPGICIPKNAQFCGGFAGFPCPEGLECYDAPGDGCDPNNGGADCSGICL